MSTVAIVGESADSWHGRRLTRAFAGLGLKVCFVSAESGTLTVASGSVDPGWPVQPCGVLVRGIPGGSLEQVILRLDRLHVLELLGIPVCNPPRVIERTVDKALTHALLARAGLPVPPTWVVECRETALEILAQEQRAGRELVVKPLFGSQGNGVQLMREDTVAATGVYYLQSRVDAGRNTWRDLRVFTVGGRARAAMWRCSRHWVTNRAQGARCTPARLEPALVRLAEAASRAVGADYAGVDLLPDASGQLWVLEVNGIPAWRGLQALTRVDIAALIASQLAGQRMAVGT